MMKKLAGIVIILLMGFAAYSQKAYEQGKVITNEGDTLVGKIRFKYPFFADNTEYLVILKAEGKRKQKFSPYQIQAYIIQDKYKFVSVSIDDRIGFQRFLDNAGITQTTFSGKYFLEVLIEGEISLLYRTFEDSEGTTTQHFLLENGNEVATRVPVLTFKKFASGYFGDYTELSDAIADQSLHYKNIYEIVSRYNKWFLAQPK